MKVSSGVDILVVDDEADIRELIAGILEDEGYAVRTAADSNAALRAIKARKPSLCVLDIWMQGGGLDGLELLSVIHELDPDIPAIMISGHGTIETAVSSIKKGAYDFIEKPFEADRLLHVVERALEAARLKREVQELKLKAGDDGELIGQSSIIAQTLLTGPSRNACSSALSVTLRIPSSLSQFGRPENNSASQPTVPASSASCSVRDTRGRMDLTSP